MRALIPCAAILERVGYCDACESGSNVRQEYETVTQRVLFTYSGTPKPTISQFDGTLIRCHDVSLNDGDWKGTFAAGAERTLGRLWISPEKKKDHARSLPESITTSV